MHDVRVHTSASRQATATNAGVRVPVSIGARMLGLECVAFSGAPRRGFSSGTPVSSPSFGFFFKIGYWF